MNGTNLAGLFAACLIVFAGCSACEKATTQQPAPKTPGKTVVIGLIPDQNLFQQIERYEPLAAYLSEKTGTRIRLTFLARYGNIIDNFVWGGMDGAFFGGFSYALAHARLGVHVLARPEGPDGVSSYHGLIFARKDSGIRSCGDMLGKRFAFVDKASSAGCLFPVAYFQKQGLDYRTYLKDRYYTGTHEEAIYDVLNKKADVGAATNIIFDRLARSDARVKNELTVLQRSIVIPASALALRPDFDPSLRQAFKTVLLAMHEDPQGIKVLERFGARRFVETTDADYQPLYRLAREIKLDFATYDFRDDL